jgi:hypothetical protein
MRKKEIRTVKISDLQVDLFVRKELDQDHALYLADLIENGVQMKDLIQVIDRDGMMNIVVDGRHRKEAYELNNVVEIKVQVLEFEDEIEMIAHAYKANTGGALPPTPQDTEHTITLLLDRGEPMKRIGELLGLPAGMARKYIQSVKSKASRQKLVKAAASITDGGLTVAKAAEQYGVDLEALKAIISGRRKKNTKMGIPEVQRDLTRNHQSLSQKNAAFFRAFLEKYEDGDVTEKHVEEVFVHVEQLQKQAARAVSNWKKRFHAMSKTSQ